MSRSINTKIVIRTVFAFLASFMTLWLPAQTLISGMVKDTKGHPVRGASIGLTNSYDGAVSDSTGRFAFKTTEKGTFNLTATNIGYNSFEEPVNLNGTPIVLNISIKEKLDELKAVTITAGSFSAGDAKRGAVLSSLDVATTAGSNADITAALKTLPGAQQVGEQEGLFVRGGAGYEAKQYIDGTLVNNPYYTSVPDIAQRGRFSPFLFKGNGVQHRWLFGPVWTGAVLRGTARIHRSAGKVGDHSVHLPDHRRRRFTAIVKRQTVFMGHEL